MAPGERLPLVQDLPAAPGGIRRRPVDYFKVAVRGVIIPCLRFLQYREVSSSAFLMPQYFGIVGDTVSCPFSLPPVGRCVIVHLKFWFFQKFLIAVFQSEAVAFRPDSNLCSSSSEGSLKIATWAPKDALLMYVQAISGWTSRQPLFM